MATMTISEEVVQPGKPVMGKMRYVAAGHVPEPSPHNFHLPNISEFRDERLLPLHNLRPLPTVGALPKAVSHAQLSTHGFTAVHHPTTLHYPPYGLSSWKDPELLKEHYVPDTAQMMLQITGCKTVFTESLLLRSAVWSESDALAAHAGHGDKNKVAGGGESKATGLSEPQTGIPQFIGFDVVDNGGVSPAPKIHLDYSPAGARLHIRKYHPALAVAAADVIRAEDALKGAGKSARGDSYANSGPRWALYSVWRPLKTVKRDPLALSDCRTFQDKDYVPVVIKTPCLGQPGIKETHNAGSYLARYSEGHTWYWIADQEPEEVLVITLFDSEMERQGVNAPGGTFHSSVDLPGTEKEEPRESLELRCLCIWE
ncbi:GA4 desaturase [Camillea tinctor]|nr:GA4 desaturase [Camillea tinctor]